MLAFLICCFPRYLLNNSVGFGIFVNDYVLNFRQHLRAVHPDPHIWDRLLYQFRTPILGILHTGMHMCMVLLISTAVIYNIDYF